jgi:hypothetical protein
VDEATQEKFRKPDVVLNNYGGHRLHFIAQVELSLSQGDSMVLVQKNAPNDLLIRTDVQPKLGFSLVMRAPAGEATDLLSGQRVTLEILKTSLPQTPASGPSIRGESSPLPTEDVVSRCEETKQPVGYEVRLLQAVRVPAGHQKLVRASIGADAGEGPLLFTP